MKQFEIKQIEDMLCEQYDYPATEIKTTAEQICQMSEMGKRIFCSFVETGVLPDVSFRGLSLLEMNRQRPGCSPVAIIIIYDGLVSAISKIR